MDWLIRKRNGSVVSYQKDRIRIAIQKALDASMPDEDGPEATELDSKLLADQVETVLYVRFFKEGNVPTVEQIQDIVEHTLIHNGLTAAAKAYILYRAKRTETRAVDKLFENVEDLVGSYIGREDWRVNENSNMNYSLQGLNFYLSSTITAKYWLHKLYTGDIQKAHSDGDMHIHDLGILGPYCVGWDLKGLLTRGFGGVGGKIESKPPKHLRTALGQSVNFLYTLQGEAAGAQAFSNFDTLLAPFVKKDNLSYEDVKQAMQEFVFSMNVPTRVGFQQPFTNITMDLNVPEFMAYEPAIVGGELQDFAYGDCQAEMDMINRAFAELMIAGDGTGRIFTFPIPTYNITEDFDWEDERLQPVWEMTGKYGIPYFSNFVGSDMDPEDARSMCCRLRLSNKELRKRGGGLFGSNPLTGSLGVVTINLPRIAYMSNNSIEFYKRLDRVMDLAKDSLELKRRVIEDLTEKGLYPYARHYLGDIKERLGSYWGNHFSTIGLVGMNEACLNFMQEDILDEDARRWASKALDHMRERISEFQETTGNLYNLEASPAEGASYRLAQKDEKEFAGAHVAGHGISYYTNSVHPPSNHGLDAFGLLQHQDELQTKFTGGTVVHLFLGESIDDWRMVRDLTKKIVNNFHLPYFSFTPTFSICPIHGYIKGEHPVCPYPHTDEEIEQFGEILKCPTAGLNPQSYRDIIAIQGPKIKLD